MKPKVAIALNTAWNIFNFRAGLIRSLVAEGYEVVAMAPPDEYVPRLADLGCRFVPLAMDNQGTHPGRDLLLWGRFYRALRAERPDVFLGYTIKPNIYGSLAAHALGIPVVNNIAGLGTAFIKDNWLAKLVRLLYRVALSRSCKVFFQNDEDRQLFIRDGLVRAESTDRLPGSGIDLARFSIPPAPDREGRGTFRFLLIARMLWEKGVGEYVQAARLLRARHPQAECCLLGFLDVKNPAAVPRAQMDEWVAEGAVRYLGVSDDVRTEIAEADCIVLPSYYREGTPRTLLEAAAMAKPIITTDVAGCRDVVENEVNGWFCREKDADDLADKMERMLLLSPEARAELGRKGRMKVEGEFDERIVLDKYRSAIEQAIGRKA